MRRVLTRGFTLIELMIAVAIIGILAAIAIPQFSLMVAKSQEGTTKGNLGTIRSALSVYYGDTDGAYPADRLDSLSTSGKYLQGLPVVQLPATPNSIGHGLVVGVRFPPITDIVGLVNGWVYDNDNTLNTWGQVVVNCTHEDIKGNVWSTY